MPDGWMRKASLAVLLSEWCKFWFVWLVVSLFRCLVVWLEVAVRLECTLCVVCCVAGWWLFGWLVGGSSLVKKQWTKLVDVIQKRKKQYCPGFT
jgi:hypothetical protein